jgi:hypothetical protein
MPQIQLVTNVAEYALFRGLARTRGRLVVSTAVVTAATFGFGLASADYILNSSTSVGLNLGLITFNMMLVLVAAYLQTVLVGDLFFSGPWREQVVLGETPTDGVSVKNHSAEFMIVLLIAVVLNGLAVDLGAGGFLETYHTEGFFRAELRSEDPGQRLGALEYMTEPLNFELWPVPEVQQLVVEHLDDPDPNVRARAIWNAGEMDIGAARDPLRRIVLDTSLDEAIRAEAAEALGQLGLDGVSREALEGLLSNETPSRLLIGALRGLALMKSPLSIKPVLPILDHDDRDVVLHAFWVLRSSGEPELRPMLHERLKATEDPQLQCALLDTLKMVATPEDVTWARRAFDRAPKEKKCEPIVWEERNERQHYVLYSDSLRVKYLKIVANASGGEQRAWFERIVADPEQPWRVREVAAEVVKRLDEAPKRR